MVSKSFVRLFLNMHRWVYQASKGKLGGSIRGMRVLLLTTVGRRTGKRRVWPLSFIEEDGCYFVIASNAGSEFDPSWLLNLRKNPVASIQINDKILRVTGAEVPDGERKRLWKKVVEKAPFYEDYTKSVKRVIPIVKLKPME